MTTNRGPSVRADARRRYVVVANAEGLGASEPAAPLPNPQELAAGPAAPAARPGGGSEQTEPSRAAAAVASETSLTTFVRTLYEVTVVPVREIARLAGVTERTIYKYAHKHGWRPRVVRLAKGAGGRFIPLADVGQPVATGIKALDPEGAKRAAARCVRAGLISGRAAEEAVAAARKRGARKAAERAAQARTRALDHLCDALVTLARICRETNGADARVLGVVERLQGAVVERMERLLEPA